MRLEPLRILLHLPTTDLRQTSGSVLNKIAQDLEKDSRCANNVIECAGNIFWRLLALTAVDSARVFCPGRWRAILHDPQDRKNQMARHLFALLTPQIPHY